MNNSKKVDGKEDEQDFDPKLIEKIVCKRTAAELKNTIINQKETEVLNKQYKLLLKTESGYMNGSMSQEEIMKNVDVSTKTKKMDITLKYGPYCIDFTRDGRYLCVGGQRGQLAVLDWKTKHLNYDINVREKIRAVKYLHRETKIAVSQLDYTYIYDNEGKELHCIREIYRADHFEYLPYHFLLVAGTEKGFIHYLDVSTGSIISNIKTYRGSVNMMCQNPAQAIIATGHNNGTVAMWTPNEEKPVMKMLCHEHSMKSIAIDNGGNYMVTSGMDRKMKVWDLRMTNEELADLRLEESPSSMQFSQKGLLAVSTGRNVHILKDIQNGCYSGSVADLLSKPSTKKLQPTKSVKPYMSHTFYGSSVEQVQFCPFEDILGCGLSTGFSTLFAPGCGEPNFDAFECNPYADIEFRKEHEVKRLLEKIPSEMISLVANVASIDQKTIVQRWEEDKSKLFDVKAPIVVKKKRSNKTKPRPATMKKVRTKDNLHLERLNLQKALFKADNVNYKVKRPLSKAPTNSVLDQLIYKV